jgi:hypothetical protein
VLFFSFEPLFSTIHIKVLIPSFSLNERTGLLMLGNLHEATVEKQLLKSMNFSHAFRWVWMLLDGKNAPLKGVLPESCA